MVNLLYGFQRLTYLVCLRHSSMTLHGELAISLRMSENFVAAFGFALLEPEG
jgi:hypothetical protein